MDTRPKPWEKKNQKCFIYVKCTWPENSWQPEFSLNNRWTKHTLFNLCWHLTFRPLRRAGLKPCGEPYGNHSSSRPQFAYERSDRAAEPSGSRCLTLPWTLPAGSLTDRSASCSNSSAEGTIKRVDSKIECKTKNGKDKIIILITLHILTHLYYLIQTLTTSDVPAKDMIFMKVLANS